MTRQIKTGIVIFGFIVAFLLLHLTKILYPLEEFIRYALSPLGSVSTKIGTFVSRESRQMTENSESLDQIDELQRQLQHLSVDYVQLHALKEENEVLKRKLGFVEQQGYEAVVANVISRSVQPERSFFMIDRGSKNGLEIGMAVIFGDGIYIGKITKIYERTAIVTLTTDPSSRVAISLVGQNRLIGLVEGRGNGTALATLIPQEENIKVNDVLVTSGTEEKIPPNLVVGLINQIYVESTDPFKEANIEPVVQTAYLNIVAVLLPKALKPE